MIKERIELAHLVAQEKSDGEKNSRKKIYYRFTA